jgi:hypothetical protein
VSQVWILDHRDCGAYKTYVGVTPDDPVKEREAHRRYCQQATEVIEKEFSGLKGHVHCLLLPIESLESL